MFVIVLGPTAISNYRVSGLVLVTRTRNINKENRKEVNCQIVGSPILLEEP